MTSTNTWHQSACKAQSRRSDNKRLYPNYCSKWSTKSFKRGLLKPLDSVTVHPLFLSLLLPPLRARLRFRPCLAQELIHVRVPGVPLLLEDLPEPHERVSRTP